MLAHDPSLVLLSTSIAILGAFTASLLTSGLMALAPEERTSRTVMAALAFGGSIWATNFVGLLAIEAPVNWFWNPLLMAAAGVIALTASFASFFLAVRNGFSSPRFPVAVVILGVGIAISHYLGLGAVTGSALEVTWFLALVAVSICVQFAALGLWFLIRRRGVFVTLSGALLLGLALTATHYIVIASAADLEVILLAIPPDMSGLSERYLAWSATIMMYLICAICCCVFVIMQFREELR